VSALRAQGLIVRFQDRIQKRMARGGTIDDIDAEIIEPADLSADQKAALWLYAWSHLSRRKQRRSAELHLRLVGIG
jgi:hypothetical protein